MHQTIEVVTVPVDQIKGIIKSLFEETFNELISNLIDEKKVSAKQINQYLEREEVAKLLNISLTTLHRRTKAGDLKSISIGQRVLYKQSEIESSLEDFQRLIKKRRLKRSV